MKKAMLYISLIMSAIYAVAVSLVIALQAPIRNAQGFYAEAEAPFIIPVPGLFVCIVMLAAVIVFDVLLLREDDNNMRAHMETTVVAMFSVLIVLMPWIFGLVSVIQVRYYSYTVGAMGVAAYGVLQQGIAACNPVLVFAMLLQVIYAGISLGKKGR